ncbi:hypothetical protein H9X96_00380 [Pedobacter sp. N36a]|uniref:M56 family metallopeptidase n=1 Tax=Pedobacter sp. N36a TaxID=2767996 RepID=UPI001656CEEC|nr:M56 family metallopeptidase [Pedobacter sp. N36a]MBC8984225.1 hypothetical protein [Pedobacter sp. N36a]
MVTYVKLNQNNPAFSFFNLLFIPSDIAGKKTILKHELVHIRQRHSLDIIFFEIIQILSWFNPITYLLKKDIKLLHEYIADEQTTLKEIGKYDYALFLFKHSFGMEAKFLFALPIAAVMLGSSTLAFTKDYSLVDLYPKKSVSSTATVLKPLHFCTKQEPIKSKTQKKPALPAAPPAPPPPGVPPPIITKDKEPIKKGVTSSKPVYP